jgi:hypothetical protein
VIYAYGTEVPSSSEVDANLIIHAEHGVIQLNLAKDPSMSTSLARPTPSGDLAKNPSTSTSLTSPSHSSSTSHHAFPVIDIPLQRYQRYIVVHAVFCTLGFLVFLPTGVISARYLRTFTPTWFQGHWIVQFVVGASRSSYVVLFSLYISSWPLYHHGLCVWCSRSVKDGSTPFQRPTQGN